MSLPDTQFIQMTAAHAHALAPEIAASDPWHRLGIETASIEALLMNQQPDYEVRVISSDAEAVGAIVIHLNWLLGPYLQHLSVTKNAQGHGIGGQAIAWLVSLAESHNQRNIWLCVSAFNIDAQRFYKHHGFTKTATLNDLVISGENEILMRRQL